MIHYQSYTIFEIEHFSLFPGLKYPLKLKACNLKMPKISFLHFAIITISLDRRLKVSRQLKEKTQLTEPDKIN